MTRQAYIKGSGDNLTASVMVFEWNRERGDAVLGDRCYESHVAGCLSGSAEPML